MSYSDFNFVASYVLAQHPDAQIRSNWSSVDLIVDTRAIRPIRNVVDSWWRISHKATETPGAGYRLEGFTRQQAIHWLLTGKLEDAKSA